MVQNKAKAGEEINYEEESFEDNQGKGTADTPDCFKWLLVHIIIRPMVENKLNRNDGSIVTECLALFGAVFEKRDQQRTIKPCNLKCTGWVKVQVSPPTGTI